MMKRIVMFTPGLSEVGGAARRSKLLASELAERGWDVRVVTRAGTLRRFESHRSRHLFALEVPGFDRPRIGGLLFLVVAIPLGLLWGWKARVFLSIQLTSQTTAASVCGSMLRKPYIALLTTGGTVSEIAYIMSRRSARLRGWFLRHARFLVAQTPAAAEDLRTSFPGIQVVVAANPVVGLEPSPLTGRPRALFTGRFSEEKDLERLLRVWRRIAAEDDDAALVLAGSGGAYRSVEEELRAMVARDDVLTRSVEFRGWVADVADVLAENDVYVFPSLSEGMSNSLLEACAAERIVVVSDIAANRAVVGDEHALLFEAGDETSMETALRAGLYDDEIRTRAQMNVRERSPMFSVDRFMDQVEELIGAAADSARH